VLIDESLALSGLLGLPVTVRLVNGEMWAYLAGFSGDEVQNRHL
jgi:hypothetical protein